MAQLQRIGLRQRHRPRAKDRPPALIKLAQQALIGSDKRAIALGRQGEMNAIVRRMIEFDRDA